MNAERLSLDSIELTLAPRTAPRRAGRSWLAPLLEAFARWNRARRLRAELATFNEHMLRDIGLCKAELERLASRQPPWR